MIDVEGALRSFLLADAAVSALTTDVFALELPDGLTMPGKAVVLQPSGGVPLAGASNARVSSQRYDVKCYGETPYQAARVMGAVHDALKQMGRTTLDSAVLHGAVYSGGRISTREPTTEWPFVFESFQVFYAENAAA